MPKACQARPPIAAPRADRVQEGRGDRLAREGVSEMATRIGVDIGGTFTDLIFYDDATGDVHVAKTATTPDALEEGVLRAVQTAVRPELVGGTRLFMHGTTIGLNALLQRSGARTGLICTHGFRDVL